MLITALNPTSRIARRTFVGELDLASEILASDNLKEAIDGDRRCLQVDFSGVTFMDCSGIRVLLLAHRQAEASHVRFKLIGRSRAVQRVLDLTDVAALFPEPPALVAV